MLSGENQELSEIFTYYSTSLESLKYYRKGITSNDVVDSNYIGYTNQELMKSFENYISELEKNISFSILSALEATFKIDYIIRTSKKHKDDLSRKLRELYKIKENNVSLEQDILTIWKQEYPGFKSIISEYIGALNYRHWLAHGRYWRPKLGREYDLSTITTIVNRVYANLPLYQSA